MKAVWSFWTKPYLAARRSSWYSERHHWLAWGLSVYTARQHYPETCLVTDDAGARILVDELQLPFEHVSTALNQMKDSDLEWWALGKVEAYRLQQAPFIHIDADVFLWKRLARSVEEADVFAQNPETDALASWTYYPEVLERAIGVLARGWLPKEWLWYRQVTSQPRGECCGIFGGTRLDFINHYAKTALRLVASPRNRKALKALPGKSGHMLLVEQYLLTACVQYHRARKDSPYSGIEIRHVFPTTADAYRPQRAQEAGFTHLSGNVKRDPRVSRDLELRVQEDLPEHYRRCMEFEGAGRVSAFSKAWQ